jgi:hypothetical protein
MDALKASPEAYLQLHLNQVCAAVREKEIEAIMKNRSPRKICDNQFYSSRISVQALSPTQPLGRVS